MAKTRDKILIIGEGITEYYYFQSLRDRFRSINFSPSYPKHSDLKSLRKEIEEGIANGHRKIFCVIDMDNKGSNNPAEMLKYQKLKSDYAKPVVKKSQGINCEVRFFETHLCTELFFLYYFRYTNKSYSAQDPLLKELNALCSYEKTEKFFKACRGLHTHFEKKGGLLDQAIVHAERSVQQHTTGKGGSYSELGDLFKELK